MTDNESRNGVFITIPAKISSKQESVRHFEVPDPEGGDPTKLVEVTLPYGTTAFGHDVSFYRTTILASQLDPAGQHYASTHSILLPETNLKTGEPWVVKLSRDFGSYGEDGTWNPDVKEISVTSLDFREIMKDQYENYKQYRREHGTAAKEQSQDGADLIAAANEARESAEDLGGSALQNQHGTQGRE